MKFRPALIGCVSAGIGVLLMGIYIKRFETEVSGGDGVEILVSLARIERGNVVSADLLTTKTIPMAYVDDRQIRAVDQSKIVGLRAAEPISVSQPLQWTDVLATREDKRDLSSLVEPGHRAVTAPFTSLPTYAMIRPGDFVDVVATLPGESGEKRVATVLLQRVLVLAIGNRTAAERPDDLRRGGGQTQPILTLSLNLREAQELALAAQRGSLSVALRNPNDQRITASNPAVDVMASGDAPPSSRDDARAFRKPEASRPIHLEASRR